MPRSLTALPLAALIALSGCANPANSDKPSTLNVEYCRKIAEETRKSGIPNYNLCPGYMPDGYEVELF